MRAIAGAILILAGCILFGIGVVADSIGRSGRVYVDTNVAISMGFGAILAIAGVIAFLYGWISRDP